tara:strand:- start:2153 stop:2347 length:195 start_codon:yes stop_codon:yes gene_type:complete
MKVNIDDIIQMKKYLAKFNSFPLNNITLISMVGDIIHLDKETLDDWDFTGLSNADFIMDKHGKS